MADLHEAARQAVYRCAKKMWEQRLVVASAGNVSLLLDGGLLAITPSSIPYESLTADQIAVVSLTTRDVVAGSSRPSTELPLHQAVYAARPDVGAIIHTHAPAVSSLSVLRRPLPPVIDEMTIYFGGTIEVAEYAFTGTEELGRNVVAALADRAGVLLANHGNVCVGNSLDDALHVALTMESCGRIYLDALAAGQPALLPAESLERGRSLYEQRLRKK